MDYKIILVPFIALIIAQLLKVTIDAAKGKFSWSNLNSYGGWPSSHSAMVAALCTKIIAAPNLDLAAVAIALTFSFLIVRDAIGIRWQLGKHAKLINQLVKDLPDYEEDKYPFLLERLGHTFNQALAGVILGILIALII